MESLQSELKFLELFGLTLEGPDNSNRYKVFDENKKEVGFIQKKKIVKKNIKKGRVATFGYVTEIETDNIIFKNIRKFNNNNDKPIIFNDKRFYYEFEVKNQNGNENVTLCLRDNPYIHMSSNEYGFLDFKLDYHSMFLNFKTQTENYNVEETITVEIKEYNDENIHQGQEYTYTISYCDKNNSLDKKVGRTTNELIAKKDPRYPWNETITLKEVYWIDGKLQKHKETEVKSTVSEVIKKHKMGIDAFKHFRCLINELIPNKKEIITAMVEVRKLNEYPFTLFIDEYKPKVNLSEYDYIKKINDKVKFGTKYNIEGNKRHHTSYIIYNDKDEVEFVNQYYNKKDEFNGYYKFRDNKIIRCFNNGTEEMSFDITKKEINIISPKSDQYMQHKLDFSKFDEVYDITDGIKFAIREDEVPSRDIHQWGYVIYDEKEIHSFEYIIALSPNDVGTTGYYSWNENYIFMFFEDGRLEKIFDIKNKTIITHIDDKEPILKEYLKELKM